MKLLTRPRQYLLEIAFIYFRHLMLHRTAWIKDKSEEADAMAIGAWKLGCKFLVEHCDYSDEPQPTEPELNIVCFQI
jgi:hypothetical protein